MNPLRFLLLQLATSLVLGQAGGNNRPASLPNDPKSVVQSLYKEVVALHPLGIPGGAAIKVFAPYLSKELLHKIDMNVACQDDWSRQNPDPNSKPPFLEFGLFSGDDMRAEPQAFSVERVQAEKDGSFLVYLRLSRDSPPDHPWTWRVATILIPKNGHLVVDDVIYLKDRPQDADMWLSEYLAKGCDGPRWVGYGDRKSDSR